MHKFELVSPYSPTGDQPEAIKKLTEGVLQAIRQLPGITGYNGRSASYAEYLREDGTPLQIRTEGAFQVVEGFEHAGKVVADSFTEKDEFFTEKGFEIEEGSPVTEGGKYAAVIHRWLAEENDLQIGDTSDDYNQLTVGVQDMHVESLGLTDIKISDQTSAQDAVKAIKAAINTVSSVRGDLGATQNRLDHTINNLSVMQENIQDAESTIRDTDVADEMMAYTKNNILVQSAQAMLAQANQIPQGVLQLLQ